MGSNDLAVAGAWIGISIISAMFLYVGGFNVWTSITVALLVIVAFTITFAVSFGLRAFQQQLPSTKTQQQMAAELLEIKNVVGDLSKKIDAIQKELQE